MSYYSHYTKGKYVQMKHAPKLVLDFNRLKLKAGQTIIDSRLRNKGGNKFSYLLSTSGLLTCKQNEKILVAHTETHNFRALIDYYEGDGIKVAWQDSSIVCNARINKRINDKGKIPEWAGFHLFGRYQTENDLYVASVRMDGNIAIKKKQSGDYTTLAMKDCRISMCDIGKIFQIRFDIKNLGSDEKNVSLKLYVDSKCVLETIDKTNIIFSGTHGIRVDYCDVDIFSISIL